jgi:membrane protein implicated in regulation of membrane protease activity
MAAFWWAWVAAGMAVAILELLLPGFIFVGIALGFVGTGLILWAGVWPTAWIGASFANALLVAAVIALVAWLLLRWTIGVRKGQSKIITRDINDD